jgi:hypothetical protein
VEKPGERRHTKQSGKRIDKRRKYEAIKKNEKGFFII